MLDHIKENSAKNFVVDNKKRERLEYVDALRGVIIVLMVMGHISFGYTFNKFIHTFHMPFIYLCFNQLLIFIIQSILCESSALCGCTILLKMITLILTMTILSVLIIIIKKTYLIIFFI